MNAAVCSTPQVGLKHTRTNRSTAETDPSTPTGTVVIDPTEIEPMESRLKQASPTMMKTVARQLNDCKIDSKTASEKTIPAMSIEFEDETHVAQSCMAALPKDIFCCVAKMAGGASLAKMEILSSEWKSKVSGDYVWSHVCMSDATVMKYIQEQAANKEWSRGSSKAAKIVSEVHKTSGPRLLSCGNLGWRNMFVDSFCLQRSMCTCCFEVKKGGVDDPRQRCMQSFFRTSKKPSLKSR